MSGTATNDRVFISFSHDLEEHEQRVLALADRLRREGLEVRLDFDDPNPDAGWPRWMTAELKLARFIIAVCTPTYCRRFEANEQPGVGLGVTYEGYLINQLIYEAGMQTDRVVPLMFSDGDQRDWVPLCLRGYTRYLLPRDHDALIGRLRERPVPRRVDPQRVSGQNALLRLPWRELPGDANLYRVFSWQYRLAPLVDRDAEMQGLLAWAFAPAPQPTMHWLSGPGGIGKTRLAAELCEQLGDLGWLAGFVNWRDEVALPVDAGHAGLCLVFDYPEEHRARMREWLTLLADMDAAPIPVRALMLGRRGLEDWDDELREQHASHLCEASHLRQLEPLSPDACVHVFEHASARYAQRYQTHVPAIDAEKVREWRARNPGVHGRPLFVTAASVLAVLEPEHAFGLGGSEIMQALSERESTRLDRLGQVVGLPRHAGSTLCGLATLLEGGLDAAAIRRLAALGLGASDMNQAVNAVAALPHWSDGALRGPSPDVLAAVLLQQALDRQNDPEVVGEWLWAVLQASSPGHVHQPRRPCVFRYRPGARLTASGTPPVGRTLAPYARSGPPARRAFLRAD